MPRGPKRGQTRQTRPLFAANRLLAPALLTLFVGLAVWAARHDSVTVDEFVIVPSGYAKLLHPGELTWLNPVNPPLMQSLLALPWLLSRPEVDESWWTPPRPEIRWDVGREFMGKNLQDYDDLFFQSRLVGIAVGLLLIVSAWRWSRWIHGDAGGLITLALCSVSPSVLGHAHLATVDVGATAFLIAASYCFHRVLVEERTWRDRYALWFALFYAAAMAAKFTALLCAPVFVAIAIVFAWRRHAEGAGARLARVGLLSAITTVGGLWILYAFDGVGAPIGDSAVISQVFPDGVASFIGSLPNPLPRWYVFGLDTEWARVGERQNIFYFLGDVSTRSHPGYFVAAMAMKEPLPHLAIGVAGLGLLGRLRLRLGPPAPWLAALLGLWFLACFSFGIGANLGIRYVLYSLVCLYVAAGTCASLMGGKPLLRGLVIAGLSLSTISVVRLGPHFLSYFNEAAGGPEGGRHLLSDSNVDWGQDLKALRTLMAERGWGHIWLSYFGPVSPAVYEIKGDPLFARPPGAKGLVAVSVHQLNGLDAFNSAAVALVEPYRSRVPIARAGYSILVFDDR